ncbi:hypothetical protein VQ045_17345 [Aurantimonas sp. E1-2-R+4]|uniref:hypothetical protein n=1 Tax=Aurantimonas sp. E1-2-R+4 TaxID=3113714 RepID=UPI002F94F6F1
MSLSINLLPASGTQSPQQSYQSPPPEESASNTAPASESPSSGTTATSSSSQAAPSGSSTASAATSASPAAQSQAAQSSARDSAPTTGATAPGSVNLAAKPASVEQVRQAAIDNVTTQRTLSLVKGVGEISTQLALFAAEQSDTDLAAAKASYETVQEAYRGELV